ncbi:MAG: hypothetical protein ACRCWM_03100 [Sarcina sp.]
MPNIVVINIESEKNTILSNVDEFSSAIHEVNEYGILIANLENYFISMIEKAIYEHADLDVIIKAQNIVAAKIQRIMKEINKVNETIGSQFKGKSIKSYQQQLTDITTTLGYFNSMIIDSFGENSN